MKALILTDDESMGLQSFLVGVIAKGSISSAPSWCNRVLGKLRNEKSFSRPLVSWDAEGNGPREVAGCSLEQILQLKQFWMCHHEELPK